MIKKRDLILALCLILAATVVYLIIRFTMKDGEKVVVYQNQKEIASYDLTVNGTYEIETGEGKNILIIEDGYAYVKEADCPDGICVNMGKISKNGENIVCLPHKIVIQVEGGDDAELDAVS